MREDFLHFIWKYKKLELADLKTTTNESIEIISLGSHNKLAGPDFFNARLKIKDQLWAGNVEIHVNSSDWYVHGHEMDANYDNVILHVVWDDDVSVYRRDNSLIPTLELKNYISHELVESYKSLLNNKAITFINCESELAKIDEFIFENWLERLYFERLESKSALVVTLLEKYNNDWEQVLFSMLLRNFGSKINADSFLSIAHQLKFSTVRKVSANVNELESLLFGLAGLLEDAKLDTYYLSLKKEYDYLRHKYGINNSGVLRPSFFKLRPPNFPTIRLSQFANVYARHNNLFSKLIEAKSVEDIYSLFNVSASSYWSTHFNFEKTSKKSEKKLSKKFIDLVIINTILPLKFNYAKYLGKQIDDEIVYIATQIGAEQNSIVEKYKNLNIKIANSAESQSILQLYNEYCSKNKCLECAIGNSLLKGNN